MRISWLPIKRKIRIKNVAGFHSLVLFAGLSVWEIAFFADGRRNLGVMERQNEGWATVGRCDVDVDVDEDEDCWESVAVKLNGGRR